MRVGEGKGGYTNTIILHVVRAEGESVVGRRKDMRGCRGETVVKGPVLCFFPRIFVLALCFYGGALAVVWDVGS